jgi:hypothetical protein
MTTMKFIRNDTNSARAGLGVVLAALLMGCAGDESSTASEPGTTEPPFAVRYSTESVALGTTFDGSVCRGSLDLLDAQVEWLNEEFAGEPSLPIWVYLYADDESESIADACEYAGESRVGGCWDGTAKGSWDFLAHELAHAAVHSRQEDPLDFLDEGAATMLEGTVARAYPSERGLVADYLTMSTAEFGWAAYSIAAHFLRWMREEYGMVAVHGWFASTSSKMSRAEIDAAFEASTGEALAGALARYVASAPDIYPSLGPFACGREESMPWRDDEVAWAGEMACGDEASIGRYVDDSTVELWRRWSVDIPNDGVYQVDVSGGGAVLTRCLMAPATKAELIQSELPIIDEWLWQETPLKRWAGINTTIWAEPVMLYAGRYDVWVAMPDTEGGAFSLRIHPL